MLFVGTDLTLASLTNAICRGGSSTSRPYSEFPEKNNYMYIKSDHNSTHIYIYIDKSTYMYPVCIHRSIYMYQICIHKSCPMSKSQAKLYKSKSTSPSNYYQWPRDSLSSSRRCWYLGLLPKSESRNLVQYEATKVDDELCDLIILVHVPFLIFLFHPLQDNKFRSKLS